MDRIKVELTHALVAVDAARNHYREHGCTPQLPRLILDAKEHVDAAHDAIYNRLKHTKRPDYLPDDDYPDLIPTFTSTDDCPACRAGHPVTTVIDRCFHTCGTLG